jgi:acyl carrier protein
LGEIEAALREQAGVKEALVVLDTPEHGDSRLVAYVTGSAQTQSVREGLSQRLPAHMVPGIIIPLLQFPLTQHGKIDRKALPKPALLQSAPIAAEEAPRPGLEQDIAAILAHVLDRASIGRRQNFFDLGADSLLATQAVFRLRERYGVELALRRLMEAATVERLAGEIAQLLAQRDETHLPALTSIQRAPRRFAQTAATQQKGLSSNG